MIYMRKQKSSSVSHLVKHVNSVKRKLKRNNEYC